MGQKPDCQDRPLVRSAAMVEGRGLLVTCVGIVRCRHGSGRKVWSVTSRTTVRLYRERLGGPRSIK